MKSDERAEPAADSLEEIPEVDFTRAIRPNRFANLRGDFKPAVFLERELWSHFGSEERVLEVLRTVVDLGKHKSAAARRR